MNEFFEFFYESDQEWMTLEDYCLEETCSWIRPNSSGRGLPSHATSAPMVYRVRISCHTIDTARSMATDDVVSIAGMKNSWRASKLCTPRRGPWRQPQTAHEGERIENRGRGQDG